MKIYSSKSRAILSLILLICVLSSTTVSAIYAASASTSVNIDCKQAAKQPILSDGRLSPVQDGCCDDCCDGKALPSQDTRSAAKPVADDCCENKPASTSTVKGSAKPVADGDCCLDFKVAVNSNALGSKQPVAFEDDCCLIQYKTASSSNSIGKGTLRLDDSCCEPIAPKVFSNSNLRTADPCATPAAPAATMCDITLPVGSVVGEMTYDTQAYWDAGKISPNVTIKAGTYWVVGEDEGDDGNEYYEIVLGCDYIYVPAESMQPSFQPPWNGQALPTTPGV